MSQNEVSKFLKKHYPKWFTAREIAEKLKIGGAIFTNMKRLKKDNMVSYRERKPKTSNRPTNEYRYK